jgi:hypothetical protein
MTECTGRKHCVCVYDGDNDDHDDDDHDNDDDDDDDDDDGDDDGSPIHPSVVCQASLASIDGSVYFSNQRSATDRSHLTVQRSDDGGKSWVAQGVLVQPGLSSGYSSLVRGHAVGDDAHGGILYEAHGGGIAFATFPLYF